MRTLFSRQKLRFTDRTLTLMTAKTANRPVKFNNIVIACHLMQPVYILCDELLNDSARLPIGKYNMPCVRCNGV
jgi:hypothetical protein